MQPTTGAFPRYSFPTSAFPTYSYPGVWASGSSPVSDGTFVVFFILGE